MDSIIFELKIIFFTFLVPNVELPALCSPEFRPGPPCDEAQVLSQFVADTVTK